MLRIAFITLAARKSGMIGALAAVGLAVVLVVSCLILLQSSLSAPLPVERLRAASVVVQASTSSAGLHGEANVSVSLGERVRLQASEAERIRHIAGVARRRSRSVCLRSCPRSARTHPERRERLAVGRAWLGELGARPLSRWRTAGRLFAVRTSSSTRGSRRGRPPRRRPGAHPDDRGPATSSRSAESRTTAPSHELPEQSAVFFRTDDAARLSGSGDRVDLLGIITRPGADPREGRRCCSGAA